MPAVSRPSRSSLAGSPRVAALWRARHARRIFPWTVRPDRTETAQQRIRCRTDDRPPPSEGDKSSLLAASHPRQPCIRPRTRAQGRRLAPLGAQRAESPPGDALPRHAAWKPLVPHPPAQRERRRCAAALGRRSRVNTPLWFMPPAQRVEVRIARPPEPGGGHAKRRRRGPTTEGEVGLHIAQPDPPGPRIAVGCRDAHPHHPVASLDARCDRDILDVCRGGHRVEHDLAVQPGVGEEVVGGRRIAADDPGHPAAGRPRSRRHAPEELLVLHRDGDRVRSAGPRRARR